MTLEIYSATTPSMRIALLVSVVLFSYSPAFPQTSQTQIDSLYQSAFQKNYEPDSLRWFSSQLRKDSEKIGYNSGILKSRIILGYYFLLNQNLDSAIYILEKCEIKVKSDNSLNGSLEHGRILLYTGRAYRAQNNHELSRSKLKSALTIFAEIPDYYYQGSTLYNLGVLDWIKSNYVQALDYFISAWQVKADNGLPPRDYIIELKGIADIYIRMGQFRKALDYLHITSQVASDVNDQPILTRTIILFGTAYSNMEMYDSALFYYTKGLELAEINNMENDAISAQLNIANTFSRKGNYKQSLLQLNILLKTRPGMPTSLRNIVSGVYAKNHFKLQNYDSSIYYASDPFRSAIKSGQKQSIVNMGELLSNSYEKLGLFDSALFYGHYYHAYKDSIYNQQNQARVSELYTKMEVYEKESEIQLMEKQKRLDDLKLRSILAGSVAFILIGILVFINFRNKRKVREQRLELEKKILTKELDKNKNLLSTHIFQMIHKSNGFEEIENQLEDVDGTAKNRIQNIININKALEKDWGNFNSYFSQVHAGYYEQLKEICPGLSISEQRMAALTKMRLTNKEISLLLNIEAKSVKMARYRLKKKLNLGEEERLTDFLDKI